MQSNGPAKGSGEAAFGMENVTNTPALMPWPARVILDDADTIRARIGEVRWSNARSPRLERAVTRLLGVQGRSVDRDLSRELPLIIECGSATDRVPRLHDDETYRLRVDANGIELAAPKQWGILHGLTTLAQLLVAPEGLRTLTIDDAPRFPWRGLLLDVARHFFPIAALERTLDGMAAAKLNVLHLHLTDDQGFRFPSKRFPDLPLLGGRGEYYSRDELATLVAHAADRGIRIVPEIDVPGHVTCWLAALPNWGARQRKLAPSQRFGVHEACLDPSNADVQRGLAALFEEVAAVFPDDYVHVGGDEVNPKWWKTSRRVARWMTEHALPDTAAAQAHFSAELVRALATLDRKAVGWDEVLHADLPKATLIQSWRGAVTRDRALAAGFDCLFSAGYYIDLFYPADVHYGFDPEASPEVLAATEAAVAADPRLAHVRDGLLWAQSFARRGAAPDPSGSVGRVLGGEACLWSEMVDASVLDVRLWSRLPAVAERLWSASDVTNETEMARRLDAFHSMLGIVANIDLDAAVRDALSKRGLDADAQRLVRPLLDALEPAKWYMRLLGKETLAARVAGREPDTTRPYRVGSRLDRLADLLSPESKAARAFSQRVACGAIDNAERAALAASWREQRTACERLAQRCGLLREVLPLSETLAKLADVLDGSLGRGEADAVLARARESQADLVLAVAPAVEALRRASAG